MSSKSKHKLGNQKHSATTTIKPTFNDIQAFLFPIQCLLAFSTSPVWLAASLATVLDVFRFLGQGVTGVVTSHWWLTCSAKAFKVDLIAWK